MAGIQMKEGEVTSTIYGLVNSDADILCKHCILTVDAAENVNRRRMS